MWHGRRARAGKGGIVITRSRATPKIGNEIDMSVPFTGAGYFEEY